MLAAPARHTGRTSSGSGTVHRDDWHAGQRRRRAELKVGGAVSPKVAHLEDDSLGASCHAVAGRPSLRALPLAILGELRVVLVGALPIAPRVGRPKLDETLDPVRICRERGVPAPC